MSLVTFIWRVWIQFPNLHFDSNDTMRLAPIHATLAPDLVSVIEMDLRDPLAKVSIGFGSFWPVS